MTITKTSRSHVPKSGKVRIWNERERTRTVNERLGPSVRRATDGRSPTRRTSSPTRFHKPRGLRLFSVLNSSPNSPADLAHVAYIARGGVLMCETIRARASHWPCATFAAYSPAQLVGDRYTSPQRCRDLYSDPRSSSWSLTPEQSARTASPRIHRAQSTGLRWCENVSNVQIVETRRPADRRPAKAQAVPVTGAVYASIAP